MTFGGGYAMLPILQREVVENKGWATEEELANWFAIGQCTPGVIAVNTATFAGRKVLGNIGGVVATLGVVFPSLIIISLLAGVITTFAEVAWVKNAFAGIRVCVCVLIFNAVVKLWNPVCANSVCCPLRTAPTAPSALFTSCCSPTSCPWFAPPGCAFAMSCWPCPA